MLVGGVKNYHCTRVPRFDALLPDPLALPGGLTREDGLDVRQLAKEFLFRLGASLRSSADLAAFGLQTDVKHLRCTPRRSVFIFTSGGHAHCVG